MFDDVKHILQNSDIPNTVKVAVTIIIRVISWLPLVFVGVGILLSLQFFYYWLAFFILIEGILLIALTYMLILIVRFALNGDGGRGSSITEPETSARQHTQSVGVRESAIQGVVGNAAFYLAIIAVFILLKIMGIFDSWFKAILEALNK